MTDRPPEDRVDDIPRQALASGLQPFLHDLVVAVRAPAVCLSTVDGQIRPDGVIGLYAYDRRVLSTMVVEVGGDVPEPVLGQALGGALAQFVGIARSVGDPTPDPTVLVDRQREVTGTGLVERITVASTARRRVSTTLSLVLGCDMCQLETVKIGHGPGEPLPPTPTATGITWRDRATVVHVEVAPAPHVSSLDDGGHLEWTLDLDHGDSFEVVVTVRVSDADRGPATFEALDVRPWSGLDVVADDRRLTTLVTQGLADLQGLTLRDADAPFLAAGAPWFLTLFGRDSLWSARMLLPLGTELALGTLTTLARRQGQVVDRSTEEEPGKILHEVRRQALVADNVVLPPVYYGTVDATPLWLCLLVDAWRWGAPRYALEPLLEPAERALVWMETFGDSDGNGFLEYIDHLGSGLSNQGWKDSGDSIQWADGRLAVGPLALCEVQGYAYEAATGAADLFEAFGRPGADRWRSWAGRLEQVFREQFWVEDELGAYPAVALDGAKRTVDSVASNMGHLLGTGLLDAEEEALVAARLAGSDMSSGFGLRTLTARSPRFSALSYHGGAVWPHDTAIAVRGLHLSGHDGVAAALTEGVLAAATWFDDRLPELFGGEQREGQRAPLAYPASCRPQAWSAAGAIQLVTSALGLTVDVPGGWIGITPPRPSPVGALRVRGLRVAGAPLDVDLDADGTVTVMTAPPGLSVRLG